MVELLSVLQGSVSLILEGLGNLKLWLAVHFLELEWCWDWAWGLCPVPCPGQHPDPTMSGCWTDVGKSTHSPFCGRNQSTKPLVAKIHSYEKHISYSCSSSGIPHLHPINVHSVLLSCFLHTLYHLQLCSVLELFIHITIKVCKL